MNQSKSTTITKSDREIREDIFKKLGYIVEWEDFDLDENDNPIYDSGEGYFWTDNDGNRSDELFDNKEGGLLLGQKYKPGWITSRLVWDSNFKSENSKRLLCLSFIL